MARLPTTPQQQSQDADAPESDRWVALGHACRLLGVNESTLRRWADEGQVRSYRTPGGHRRFAESDLHRLMSGARRGRGAYGGLGDVALARIRWSLHQGKTAAQPWYRSAHNEQERERLRLLGRRLIELVPDFLTKGPRHTRALAEAREIGAEYGEELRRIGLSSRDAVEAFTFFRRSLVQGATQFTDREGLATDAAEAARDQISTLADEVLLALLDANEATAPASQSAGPESTRP